MRLCGAAVAVFLAACNAPAPWPSPSPTGQVSPAQDACHVLAVTYCSLNPAVTQASIRQTICVSGWTKTIRPPSSYTDALKRQQMQAEGLTGSPSGWEEDHRMPLGLGGAPKDTMNLSPELGEPNAKDADEMRLQREVCAGRLTLEQAQQELVMKWLGSYPTYR